MENFWKQSEGLVTRLKDKVIIDVFTSARLRISILYFLISLVVLFVAGLIVYNDVFRIVETVIVIIQNGIAQETIKAAKEATSTQPTGFFAASAINSELESMMVVVGIWIIVSLSISAYIFSFIVLRPVERALNAQKRFVANVSHELRTPLSIMKTESETVLMDKDSSTKEELLAVIESGVVEVDRMSKIIQFLLNFSNFGSRMKNLSMLPLDIKDLVRETVKMTNILAKEKNVSVEIQNDSPAPITIYGNSVALEEMFLNIMKNAVRYAPSGSKVMIDIGKRRYGSVTISIKDFGMGIDPEDLPHIFEPFYKGKNVSNPRKDNAGLGLAIVKEIANLHKGTVSAQSVVGEWTVVTVRLPATGIQGI